MNEHDIERMGSRLGSRVHVDVEGVAQHVVAQLRKDATGAPWWRRASVLRVAAAVLILVTGGVLVDRLGRRTADGEASFPIGLEELSVTGLNEMLDSLDFYMPVSELVPPSLDELDEAQLRDLLAAMEG
jgi:hypothetical protein